MFYSDEIDVDVYTELMEQQKKINIDWLSIRKSKQYKVGLVFCELAADIKRFKIGSAIKAIKRWIRGAKVKKVGPSNLKRNVKKYDSPNYFSNDRIAVYTAIFGNYDKVSTPYSQPDNCDFYIFTDQNIEDSIWKKMDCPTEIIGLTDNDKNRYLKMHPHKLFKNYKYSIYVDGNVQIITDLTEYINRLGDVGIGIHLHDCRNCVYDEIEAMKKARRVKKQSLKEHYQYLIDEGMPRNYGLLQCNVIVRQHLNPTCVSIMEDWWKEYQKYSKRDQISLPHILFKHHINIEEVGILGDNVYRNPSFRIIQHL